MSNDDNDGTSRDPARGGWRIVVPVKAQRLAKSRLHPPAGVRRSDLAHAFALDTLDAAAACVPTGQLVVVTSDGPTRDHALRHKGLVVDDPASASGAFPAGGAAGHPADPLNAAVSLGLRTALHTLGNGPTAVLLGDLPALRAEELEAALQACLAYDRAFVPDAEGTGTVLLAARRTTAVLPSFGTGSAAAHEGRGYRRLTLDLPGLRTDVDDDVALSAVGTIGLGPHTAAVLCAAVGGTAAGC